MHLLLSSVIISGYERPKYAVRRRVAGNVGAIRPSRAAHDSVNSARGPCLGTHLGHAVAYTTGANRALSVKCEPNSQKSTFQI